MKDQKFTYQCFFVDRFNWLRNSFINLNAGAMGWHEKGETSPMPAAGPQKKVAVSGVPKGSTDEVIAKAVRYVAEAATDFSWLSKGDSVLIKPACNSGEKYPATTHPAGIAAMAKLLKEKGAGKVIVSDMAGIEHLRLTPDTLCGSTRMLMQRNGIFQAAESAGAETIFAGRVGLGRLF